MAKNKCYVEMESEKALRNIVGEDITISIHVGNRDNDVKVMTITVEKTDEHTFSVVAIAEDTRDRLETITDVDSDTPPILDDVPLLDIEE